MGRIVWTNRHAQIVGATDMGKTVAAQAMLRARNVRRFIVLDPQADYLEGTDVQCTFSRFDALDAWLDDVSPGDPFSCSFICGTGDDSAAAAAEQLAKRTHELGDTLLVVEESHYALKNVKRVPTVVSLARAGRHRNNGVWVSGQRHVDVPTDIRSECRSQEVISFRLGLVADVDEFAREHGNEIAELVGSGYDGLAQLHAVRILPTRPPEVWHVSSFAPPTFEVCTCRGVAQPVPQ